MRKTIIKALNKNNGNVSNTAKCLGISRTGIYYKMNLYGIEPRDYRNKDYPCSN